MIPATTALCNVKFFATIVRGCGKQSRPANNGTSLAIKTAVLASHQRNPKYGYAARMQCIAMPFLQSCNHKAIKFWRGLRLCFRSRKLV